MRYAAAVLAICAGLGSGSAEALSCFPVEPAQAFGAAQAASKGYSVVVGQFTFDASALPKAGVEHGGSSVSIQARLSGRALSKNGFNAQYSKPVRLDVSCVASWCGSVTPGAPYLVFVEHGSKGLSVEVDACPGWIFPNPTRADEDEMLACLHSGTCRPAF